MPKELSLATSAYPCAMQLRCCPPCLQGLLNKRPADRLAWPDLLDHPFVRETPEELRTREAALAGAHVVAQESRGWKGEGGAIAGLQGTQEAAQSLHKTETAAVSAAKPVVWSSAHR